MDSQHASQEKRELKSGPMIRHGQLPEPQLSPEQTSNLLFEDKYLREIIGAPVIDNSFSTAGETA